LAGKNSIGDTRILIEKRPVISHLVDGKVWVFSDQIADVPAYTFRESSPEKAWKAMSDAR